MKQACPGATKRCGRRRWLSQERGAAEDFAITDDGLGRVGAMNDDVALEGAPPRFRSNRTGDRNSPCGRFRQACCWVKRLRSPGRERNRDTTHRRRSPTAPPTRMPNPAQAPYPDCVPARTQHPRREALPFQERRFRYRGWN